MRFLTDENALGVFIDDIFWKKANNSLEQDETMDVISSRCNKLLKDPKKRIELKFLLKKFTQKFDGYLLRWF